MVESNSASIADESIQEAPRVHGQPQISNALKKKIQQELEERLEEDKHQKSQIRNTPATRQEFAQFEKVSSMPRGSQLPRSRREEGDKHSYDGDDGGSGGLGNCLASLIQWPVIIAASIIVPVFGVTFIIIGGLNINHCKIDSLIPIWLIIQGIIMLFGIGTGGMVKRSASKSGKVSAPFKIIGFIISLTTAVWFIFGNILVYRALAQNPDFSHYWFHNSCNKSAFNLALYGVIILDALFIISIVVGCIAYVLRGCKSR